MFAAWDPENLMLITLVAVTGAVCPFRGVCYLWVSCCKQVAGGERREPGFAG